MVEARRGADADGIRRPTLYGIWRQDKPAKEGYSADLVHHETPQECYDDFNKLPQIDKPIKTILGIFLDQVQKIPNLPLLGTRVKNPDGTFGAYEWQTYQQVHTVYEEVAKGMRALNLCQKVDSIKEDGKDWSFCGIWSKNRSEWHTTQLSCMVNQTSVIGFYDSMGDSAVDYIVKQTHLDTMCLSAAYLKKILRMREQGLGESITNIVMFDTDEETAALKTRAKEQFNIQVVTFDEVREAGRNAGDSIQLEPEKVQPDDIYMLNYTSGTTGDSKGVKVSHWGILCSSYLYGLIGSLTQDDTIIDYLPAPHVFDQFMFVAVMIAGGKQGYYQGDPLKLTEDCQVLQPTVFPSVPRLYNKIYAKIQAGLGAATGCKKWLIDRGMASKEHYLTSGDEAVYSSPCYDALIFGKIKKLLGGRVKFMITASAPISGEVLSFLKIAFCCPVVEAYGLSETSGAVTLTFMNDPVSGTIGGPMMHTAIRLKDLPEMNYRIDDKPFPRGEICVRSPCVTSGYFLRPDKTAEAIDEDGYLHTGDVGVVYPNGTIKILDRSKSIFKLSQGEYVAPEKIENILIQSQYVAQIMLYGHSLKNCCVAIVVVDPEALRRWSEANGKDDKQVIADQDADFKKAILDEMNALAAERNLNSLEKPKDIYLSIDPFSVENDILTPTFKLKRNVGQKVYQAQIDALYEALAAKGM